MQAFFMERIFLVMKNIHSKSVLYACWNTKHVKAHGNNSHFHQNKTIEIVQNNRKQRK